MAKHPMEAHLQSTLPLRDLCILLLEDDALISIDSSEMLQSLGAAQVLVAYTLAEAEEILARERIDAAVLDLVIGRERAEALVASLLNRPLPVVIASGAADNASLPPGLRDVPMVDKPYTSQALCMALTAALGPSEPFATAM